MNLFFAFLWRVDFEKTVVASLSEAAEARYNNKLIFF